MFWLWLICIAIILALAFWADPKLNGAMNDDPVIFDGRDPSQLIEAASVFEQRKSGRERGGPIVVITDGDEPRNFEAQLALKSIQGKVNIREATDDG